MNYIATATAAATAAIKVAPLVALLDQATATFTKYQAEDLLQTARLHFAAADLATTEGYAGADAAWRTDGLRYLNWGIAATTRIN